MILAFSISIGGGIGAALRFWFTRFNVKTHRTGFPRGTFLANLLGSFLLGFLVGRHLPYFWLKVIGTGFCGGLTTFSTFNFEVFELKSQNGQEAFLKYLFTSYVTGFLIVILGYQMGKFF